MKLVLSALVPTLLFCGTAHGAGPFRCEGKLIEPGVPIVYVLQKCGRPEAGITEDVLRRARTAAGFSRFAGIGVSDQWIYDRGPGRFPAVLIFHDGRLIRIEYLSERS